MTKLKKGTGDNFSAMLSHDVTFRKYRNQVVASVVTIPRKSKSKKKKEAINRFRKANAYAKSILKEPGMNELYAKGINDKKRSAHTVAVADYLNAPEIQYIRMNVYQGVVGEKLRIKVTDDFQVTAVHVRFTSSDGELLEEGAAERYTRKPSMWVYTLTGTNPIVVGTAIEVIAQDRPGNKAMLESIVRDRA